MESIFFNITDTRYKLNTLYQKDEDHINRVDISNGIVYLDISIQNHQKLSYKIQNLDHLIAIVVMKSGDVMIKDSIEDSIFRQKSDEVVLYSSKRQELSVDILASKKSEIFVLFIADFFFKRYLSYDKDEPIDFLYNSIKESSLQILQRQPLDAMTIYQIDKILSIQKERVSKSIKSIYHILDFIIDRVSLLDLPVESVSKDDMKLAKRAKNHLLKNYVIPPSIKELAHICATNEHKLKNIFKMVYNKTIYNYIQELRLQSANKLLKEKSLTIGDVAKRVGYSHQSYFSKLFFKRYGIYPKELIKKSLQ